jgi:hypothetical protein
LAVGDGLRNHPLNVSRFGSQELPEFACTGMGVQDQRLLISNGAFDLGPDRIKLAAAIQRALMSIPQGYDEGLIGLAGNPKALNQRCFFGARRIGMQANLLRHDNKG